MTQATSTKSSVVNSDIVKSLPRVRMAAGSSDTTPCASTW